MLINVFISVNVVMEDYRGSPVPSFSSTFTVRAGLGVPSSWQPQSPHAALEACWALSEWQSSQPAGLLLGRLPLFKGPFICGAGIWVAGYILGARMAWGIGRRGCREEGGGEWDREWERERTDRVPIDCNRHGGLIIAGLQPTWMSD